MKNEDCAKQLGGIVKEQRIMRGLTLRELAAKPGVSASHLARTERGERFPSARILGKIAQPLGFSEGEVFTFAGFLPPQPLSMADSFSGGQLDPYLAAVLLQEPAETQRTLVIILGILKSIAKSIAQENSGSDARELAGKNLSSENLG